jgi:hypothetical protein
MFQRARLKDWPLFIQRCLNARRNNYIRYTHAHHILGWIV